MCGADLFKNACRIHTRFALYRYLMACSAHRLDGAEKAKQHIDLCSFYVAAFNGLPEADRAWSEHEAQFMAVHEATQQVTDHLDEQIGFPLSYVPDYDKLVPLFFDKFHDVAVKALNDKT